jgi:3-deoxy-manno-octulosonate cytidylyltransferase (CMP-KDO synthetase)
MNTLIVVPARYNSTRFPGKPLKIINGLSMLQRTAISATRACEVIDNAIFVVATDDNRIETHCKENSIPVIMTPKELSTGSDRTLYAAECYAEQNKMTFDFILNLQGDAPFTPIEHLLSVHQGLETGCDVSTPFVRLSWEDLDRLRVHKKSTPFSGTSIIISSDNRAIWFSKNIIPAIRKEDEYREKTSLSPVLRHVGLYGYTIDALRQFSRLPMSYYEKMEGLEQLRLLENGFHVRGVEVQPSQISLPGIDTPQDLSLAIKLISLHGDPHL